MLCGVNMRTSNGLNINSAMRLAVSVVAILLPLPAGGADQLVLTFAGIVEPRERVAIANQVSGVVSNVRVVAGQHVERGDVLFEIDVEPFKIDVATAKAELDEARARFRLADDISSRQGRLAERGSGAEARATQSVIEVETARAVVARQESALARAELALARTRIVAPISGTVGKTKIAPGSFVEAEGGTVLGEVVQLDPILVGYRVPYADRQRSLETARVKTPRELFEKVTVELILPSGSTYPHLGKPKFESGEVDRDTGELTTWAEFQNPDGILMPGLSVNIRSEIQAAPQSLGEPK